MTIVNVLQLAEQCRKINPIEDSTYANWLKALKPIQHLSVQEIDKQVVMQYRISQRKPDGPLCDGTFKQRVGYLKGIWNTAIEWELIDGDNPWLKADRKLQVKKRRDPDLHPWEFYERYHKNPRFRCLWYHGFRISELVCLYKENVVWDAEIPYFNIVSQPNNKLKNLSSIRKTPIHPACYADVERLRFGGKRPAGWKWGQDLRQKLGLPPGDASHSLRHSFTSRMNEAGIIQPVQDALLGHEPDTKTGHYGKVTLEVKLKALEKLR